MTKKRISKAALTIILFLIAAIYLYPIFIVIVSAIKTKHEFATNPFGFPKNATLENFKGAIKQMNFLRSTFNTLFVASFSVFIGTITSAMAAYAITRRSDKLYNAVYMFFLAGLIVPFQMVMIPLYKIMNTLQFTNTYHGMILVYTASIIPFSIFLFCGFINTIPLELEEAALIDGCNIFQTFYRIVLPLLKPAISTVAVLNTFGVWNDFLSSLLFLQHRNMATITVQLYNFVGQYFNDWSRIFAGICLIVAPMILIYIFGQKYIISGITAGGTKG